MVTKKSLDEFEIIAALLRDTQMSHSEVFTPRALRLTVEKLRSRYAREGIGLLTKTLPRLAKALDRALTGEVPLDCTGFRKKTGTKLPRFLGELFQCIFTLDGWVLPTPCVNCVTAVRQILLIFYKYKLPYELDQNKQVLDLFERTDDSLACYNSACCSDCTSCDLNHRLHSCPFFQKEGAQEQEAYRSVAESARRCLSHLFAGFDHRDIYPRHGPGSVSTKETLSGKYRWTKVSQRLIDEYPLDEYFYASLGHVCDRFDEIQSIEIGESNAKVILVPKDSRGPRLISEEPLVFQWIQQGLMRHMVEWIEHHPRTRNNVRFTDQRPNQWGALLGSLPYGTYRKKSGEFITYPLQHGRYSTLDLSEASDRVSVGLVRLLFPDPLKRVLESCRSLATELPCGKVRRLNKFAPMGSALCFPVLALSIWAILTAGAPDADTRECIFVYGDDIVVPTAYAASATKLLEAFGFKVNLAKSCTKGFFRESCGVEAFRGVDVTPVRLRTPWVSTRRPDVYCAWIAYANSLYKKRYYDTYRLITDRIFAVYGEVPSEDMKLSCPSLVEVPEEKLPNTRRSHKGLQKLQWRVWDVKAKKVIQEIDGWKMLLRYFAESVGRPKTPVQSVLADADNAGSYKLNPPFSVSEYTRRDSSNLVKCWR